MDNGVKLFSYHLDDGTSKLDLDTLHCCFDLITNSVFLEDRIS
jgi:hypothetical protein